MNDLVDMKKTVFVLASVLTHLPLIACTRETVTAPVDAPIAPVVPSASAPLPPPDAPREVTNELPAGPGVTLLSDQFLVLIRERQVTDRNVPFEQRVALAERSLGKGEILQDPLFEGVVWRALGARSTIAPFGCQELILSRTGPSWTMRPADHALCGLPYTIGELTKPFSGPSPKRTAFRLEEVLGEAGVLAPDQAVLRARSKLGLAENHVAAESVWYGIAGRTKDAPISCKALYLGGRPRIEDAPLSSCNLAWPMPGMTFAKSPEVPAIDKTAKLAECSNKCSTAEVCMIDQRVPAMAQVYSEADGSRARYPDGRPVATELVASCVPIPKTCSTLDAACFFPPPQTTPGPLPPLSAVAGPCPKDAYGGRAFLTTPSTHIMCFSRVGQVYPRVPVTVPPPPAAPAPSNKVPQTRGPTAGKPKGTDLQILF